MMGRTLALTTDKIATAAEMYSLGHSAQTIANLFSVSVSAVISALRHAGVTMRRAGDTMATKWTLDELRMRCIEDKHECWLWQGCKNPNGYGRVRIRNKTVYTHRLAFALSGRIVPPRHDVCHHCDVRLCCNPDHLFSGTRFRNMRDAKEKGRLSMGVLHGARVRDGIARSRSTRIT